MAPIPPSSTNGKLPICIVDASASYRSAVAGALSRHYDVTVCAEQRQALDAIVARPPVAVVLDENVTPKGGLQLLRDLCGVPGLGGIPIICTAASDRSHFLADATAFGVRTALVKPFRRSVLLKALEDEIGSRSERSWPLMDPVHRAALKRTSEIFNAVADLMAVGQPLPFETLRHACLPLVEAVRDDTYKVILDGVRHHHNYSYVHSLRVAMFLTVFGYSIGLRDHDLMVLATGGLVHDVGKLAVPPHVLDKPERLSDQELSMVRGHVCHSRDFLRASPTMPRGTLLIAEQHHEKLDGTGYPAGLKGTQVNELARMATIIDIFCALTDRRAYKSSMEPEQALHVMTQMGRQIDQSLLTAFRNVLLDTARTLDQ